MRNLIVCCDGTWNTPEQKKSDVPVPTNVVRLYHALSDTTKTKIKGRETSIKQLRYYHPGVGTEGNMMEKVLGGVMGFGLDKNIVSAYRWLADNYQIGDRICCFGFSRGAFTVRSLAGMIAKCGLLDPTGLEDKEIWRRVQRVYDEGYRSPNKDDEEDWAEDSRFHDGDQPDGSVGIHFIGVWDTVGALGVPDDMAILNLIDEPRRFRFHDTKLSAKVCCARHAVALDERRASFTPTLWRNIEAGHNVKQVWFPGVHSDVGGGYKEKGLSDGALWWMITEAANCDIGFRKDLAEVRESGLDPQIKPDPWDVLHDSDEGLFAYLRTQPRSVPRLDSAGTETMLHESVSKRRNSPPIAQGRYRDTIVLKNSDKPKTIEIFAREPWNATEIYLEGGAKYRFEAKGEWLDRDIACGPGGSDDGMFNPWELAQLAGSLWGKVEKLYKGVTGNEAADFRGTRRHERMPWFALVGVIANGGNPRNDGTPEPHEAFEIGDGRTYEVEKSGYLYCFANDAWHFYDNNRGSVRLTVARTS